MQQVTGCGLHDRLGRDDSDDAADEGEIVAVLLDLAVGDGRDQCGGDDRRQNPRGRNVEALQHQAKQHRQGQDHAPHPSTTHEACRVQIVGHIAGLLVLSVWD